jgi:hypothetical protein
VTTGSAEFAERDVPDAALDGDAYVRRAAEVMVSGGSVKGAQ